MPADLVLCYSRADGALCRELERHLAPLQRAGMINAWHREMILPGDRREDRIRERFDEATLIVLLVTPDFLASPYCHDVEMVRALERHSHGAAHVVPVLVKTCSFATSPLAGLQLLPRDGKPVSRRRRREDAWAQVVEEIGRLLPFKSLALTDPMPTAARQDLVSTTHRWPADWRADAWSAARNLPPFVPPSEFAHLRQAAKGGYAWLYGIHGIGKTTLIREVLCGPDFQDRLVVYFDCRAEALTYHRPVEAILAAFGIRAPADDRTAFRALRSHLQSAVRPIYLVLDEVDAFQDDSVLELREFFAAVRGAALISAYAPEFFLEVNRRRNRTSEPPPHTEMELGPLEVAQSLTFFEASAVPARHRRRIARLAGGNPTLMTILTSMYTESKQPNPFHPRNKLARASMHRYFERLWHALQDDTRARMLLTIIGITIERAGVKLDSSRTLVAVPRALFGTKWFWGTSISSFRDGNRFLCDIVSPIFMVWVLSEHLNDIGPEFVVARSESCDTVPRTLRDGWAGVSLDVWLAAAQALRELGSESEVLNILLRAKKAEKWYRETS